MTQLPELKTFDEILNGFGLEPEKLTPEERSELSYLIENINKSWARKKLVQKYGVSDDSDNADSNSRISDQ